MVPRPNQGTGMEKGRELDSLDSFTVMNLLPHELTIYDPDSTPDRIPSRDHGKVIQRIPPSGIIARISTETVEDGAIATPDGTRIPTYRVSMKNSTSGLPDPQDGVIYIVSLPFAMFAINVTGRDDIFFPTRDVRTLDGAVIGCRGLGQIASQ